MSSYLTFHVMGTLLPATFVIALLADLLLTPALIKLGAIRFTFARAGAGARGTSPAAASPAEGA